LCFTSVFKTICSQLNILMKDFLHGRMYSITQRYYRRIFLYIFFHEDLPQSSCIWFSSINYCTTTKYSFKFCQDFTHINKHRMIAVGSKGLPHNIFYAKTTLGTTIRVVCCDGGRGGGGGGLNVILKRQLKGRCSG
jgi:hypothetical protein